MDFLEFFDKKAKEKNWPHFFLTLLEFLVSEELKWVPDTDDVIKDTYSAFISIKNTNGEPKIVISIVKIDDTYCTANVEYRINEDISAMFFLIEMGEKKTEIFGFYRHYDNIKIVIVGEENEILKLKFKDLHDKLIHSRL